MVRLKAKHYVLGGFVFRDILVVAGGYNDEYTQFCTNI